jgi:hypothetical protein
LCLRALKRSPNDNDGKMALNKAKEQIKNKKL